MRLEPLSISHTEALVAAAGEDDSTFGWTTVPRDPEAMRRHVDRLLAARTTGEVVPYAQVELPDGRPVGMTCFLALRCRGSASAPYAVAIGATWLAASAQRRGINLEAKLLLLSHAFVEWNVGRVELQTDVRNERSRAAIEGIGATFEGVLRNWQPSHAAGEQALLRDTAMYSITAEEWPAVGDRFSNRILTADDHRAPTETAFLLRASANARRLSESMGQAREGRVQDREFDR